MKVRMGIEERHCICKYGDSEQECEQIARQLREDGYDVEVLPCNWSGLWMAVATKVTLVKKEEDKSAL